MVWPALAIRLTSSGKAAAWRTRRAPRPLAAWAPESAGPRPWGRPVAPPPGAVAQPTPAARAPVRRPARGRRTDYRQPAPARPPRPGRLASLPGGKARVVAAARRARPLSIFGPGRHLATAAELMTRGTDDSRN